MRSLILPSRYSAPTIGTPIDWSNPLTYGLAIAVPANEGAGNPSYNLVDLSASTNIAAYPTWTGSTRGIARLYDGTSQKLTISDNSKQIYQGGFTLATLAMYDGGSHQTGTYFWDGDNDRFYFWYNWTGLSPNNTLVVGYKDTGGGFHDNTAAYTMPTNSWNFYAASHNGTIGSIYVDGHAMPMTATNGGATFQGTPNNYNSIGGIASGASGFGGGWWRGGLGLSLMWNRALTSAEHLQLAANPYAIFQSAPIRKYYNGFTARSSYDNLIMGETGLIAYYPLNEKYGTTATDLKGSYNGTINGTVTLGATSLLGQDSETAMTFDGSTGFIALPSSLPLTSLTSFSVECWASLGAQQNGYIIANATQAANSGFELTYWNATGGVSSPGGFSYNQGNGSSNGGAYCQTGFVLSLDTYHIVVSWNGTKVSMYLNGALQNYTETISGLGAPGNVVNIGGTSTTTSTRFKGTIQKVAFYNTALTQTQAINHFTAGATAATNSYANTVLADSPTRYYRLGDAVGSTTATDASSNAVTAAVNSTAHVTFGQTSLITNTSDTAVKFDGSGMISTTSTVGLPTTGAFTMECWLNYGGGGAATQVAFAIGTEGSTNGKLDIAVLNTGNWFCTWSSGADSAHLPITQNTWTHIMVTYNGSNTVLCYWNSILVSTSTATLSLPYTATKTLGIGQTTDTTSYPYTGIVDEASVFNSALTATQVKKHYIAGLSNVTGSATPVTVGDSATLTDTLSFGTIQPPISDSATLTDTLSFGTIQPPISDSATLTDTPSLATVQPPISDSATGTDTPSFGTVQPPISDSATGTDSVSVNAGATPVPVTDGASLTETVSIPVTFSLSDSGTLTDSILFSNIAVGVSDSATGSEAITFSLILASVTDAATGAETLTISATAPVVDSASGTDSISITTQAPITDAGTGSESISATAQAPITDAGTGSDSTSITAQASVSDAGTGSDSVNSAIQASVSDTGTGSDTLAISTVTIPLSDAASALDSLSLGVNTVQVPDSANGSDTAQSAILVTLIDSATGAEIQSVLVQPFSIPGDAATGSETLYLFRILTVADSGSAHDFLQVLTTVALNEIMLVSMIVPQQTNFLPFTLPAARIAMTPPSGITPASFTVPNTNVAGIIPNNQLFFTTE